MSESKGEEGCQEHTNTSQETVLVKQPFFKSAPQRCCTHATRLDMQITN